MACVECIALLGEKGRHDARELDGAGADGLVLFNRFYQPDIDPEELTATRTLHLSDSSELRLRLHWMAILSGRVRASLAVTGGVHTALDASRPRWPVPMSRRWFRRS
jgi:dihydroorotate dehydrogenase